MSISLAEGVHLHVVHTRKYKTIRFIIRFSTGIDKETITKRSLLANLLETNSLNYPTQVKMSGELAELYGATFGIQVTKKGNLHFLTVSMNMVNPKYLTDKSVLTGAIKFLKEIIFYPNIHQGKFDEQTFKREKENLADYYRSISEDKQLYSSLALQNLFFNQSQSQKIPSFGTLVDLEEETASSIADYYFKMLREDQVDIIVLGDVEEEEIAQLCRQLPFDDRVLNVPNIFYEQSINNVIEERTERESLAQSKLNLGYHTGVYYGDSDYWAAQVFNGLFGGFPHSKLFMNIREKENLAYYASSSIDTFRSFMNVQTGIDCKNRNQVLRLIATELEHIRQGNITSLEMEQTKAMLKNQYLLALDNATAAIESEYIDGLLPDFHLSDDEWLTRLNHVSIKDVQRVATRVQLQAIFFLEGEEVDE